MNKIKEKKKLIFVYNADSGLKNALKDSVHKILSPKTYQCKLCDLTFGPFKEKKVWKDFRKQNEFDMKFLHADEFEHLYKSKFRPAFELPVILIENHYELEVLISKSDFEKLDTVQALIEKINNLKVLKQ